MTVNAAAFHVHVFAIFQAQVEVLQLWLDEEDSDMAHSGENIKMKLKNVEEEVRHLLNAGLLLWDLYLAVEQCW